MGARFHSKKLASTLGLWAAVLIATGGLQACSMGQTAGEDDSIELAGGPDGEEVAETDAAPAETAELAAQPEVSTEASVEKPEELAAAPAPVIEEPKVASVSPAPAPALSQPSEPAVGGESYTVRSGDTLMKIAFESYGDLFAWKKIFQANSSTLQDPNVLVAGTTLVLPKLEGRAPASIPEGSEKYKVKQGDTLGSIAGKVYGEKSMWKRLWEQNKAWIKNPNKIFAGFYVYYSLSEEDKARAPASAK